MLGSLRGVLFSPKGMRIVNVLFFLAFLFRKSGVIVVAYTLWLIYLYYGMKLTSSKSLKTVYVLLSVFAAVLLALNLVSLLMNLWH